jgi:hypothetical protein
MVVKMSLRAPLSVAECLAPLQMIALRALGTPQGKVADHGDENASDGGKCDDGYEGAD